MSDGPSPGNVSTAASSESPGGGFRSFWKKSDKESRNATFVQQDPSTKKSNRLSRILKRDSTASPMSKNQASPEDSAQNEAQKRRQQVYSAQK